MNPQNITNPDECQGLVYSKKSKYYNFDVSVQQNGDSTFRGWIKEDGIVIFQRSIIEHRNWVHAMGSMMNRCYDIEVERAIESSKHNKS